MFPETLLMLYFPSIGAIDSFGPVGSQGEDILGVVGTPPGAGALKSLLHEVTMSALDFP